MNLISGISGLMFTIANAISIGEKCLNAVGYLMDTESLDEAKKRTFGRGGWEGKKAWLKYNAPSLATGTLNAINETVSIKDRRRREKAETMQKALNSAQNFGARMGNQIVKNSQSMRPYMIGQDIKDVVSAGAYGYEGGKAISDLLKMGVNQEKNYKAAAENYGISKAWDSVKRGAKEGIKPFMPKQMNPSLLNKKK